MIQSNLVISATPKTIIRPLKTMAPKMPQNSTLCWYSAGTLNAEKMTAMTNTLSILRESSIRYPVIYFKTALSGASPVGFSTSPLENSQWITPLKLSATVIHMAVQIPASLVLITWSFLWKTPRSNARNMMISAINKIHTHITVLIFTRRPNYSYLIISFSASIFSLAMESILEEDSVITESSSFILTFSKLIRLSRSLTLSTSLLTIESSPSAFESSSLSFSSNFLPISLQDPKNPIAKVNNRLLFISFFMFFPLI